MITTSELSGKPGQAPFEPPRAFTQHAFQVPWRGLGWVWVDVFGLVTALRGLARTGAEGSA